MLEAVQSLCPILYPFVHSAYASTSELQWGERTLQSAEGVQQGDPLHGPTTVLFDLAPTLSTFEI